MSFCRNGISNPMLFSQKYTLSHCFSTILPVEIILKINTTKRTLSFRFQKKIGKIYNLFIVFSKANKKTTNFKNKIINYKITNL